jgi:L-lysine 2,3-aminomutase
MTEYGRNIVTQFKPVNRRNIHATPQWELLSPEMRRALLVVSAVLPFRTNRYVMEELIDWRDIPADPIFQLTFPQSGMLDRFDFEIIAGLMDKGAPEGEIAERAAGIRRRMNPHPSGQMEHNVPRLDGRRLPGMQHKYRETVLFFAAQAQTCHAYCTFCFRWAQFVGNSGLKFESSSVDDLTAYLERRTEVTDLLFTGGDPMVMSAEVLGRYLEPLLEPRFDHLQTIRIGTKAVSYWPRRFVSDRDADDLLRLFERVVDSRRHLAVMAHYCHPRELSTPVARRALRRIRSTGAEVRIQSPLVRHVNDDAEVWAETWRTGVRLGAIPYYMFVERDTGPKNYFEVPLAEAWEIYQGAAQQVSGLGRTARGPVMSALPGKVRVAGVTTFEGIKVFVLEYLQARDPDWVHRPFFAEFDHEATWFDQLRPLFDHEEHFFGIPDEDGEGEPWEYEESTRTW